MHNGGHAVCAYLGKQKGYEYIWQAIADPEIYEAAKAAHDGQRAGADRTSSARACAKTWRATWSICSFRFQNRALKDTVARVGADPVRKLRRNDRIVGAALFAMEQGVDPSPIITRHRGRAEVRPAQGDATAPEIQKALQASSGVDYVIEAIHGAEPRREALSG